LQGKEYVDENGLFRHILGICLCYRHIGLIVWISSLKPLLKKRIGFLTRRYDGLFDCCHNMRPINRAVIFKAVNGILAFWMLRCVTPPHFSQEAISSKFKARARNWHGDYEGGFTGNYEQSAAIIARLLLDFQENGNVVVCGMQGVAASVRHIIRAQEMLFCYRQIGNRRFLDFLNGGFNINIHALLCQCLNK